jgi:radical SAM protein with 4Fe4S-binding SPASM domain
MLHSDFCKFLRRAKDLDFNVTVLSNLTLLNDEIIDALKYKHVACVNVSLYSMEPEIHDTITTVKGSFEKTKNNILRLIDNNIAVQINCPVMKQNKDSFHQVIIWGQEHKCSVVTDYIIMGRSDRTIDNLNNRLSQDDLKYVIEKIAENNVFFRTNLRSEGVFAKCTSEKNVNKRVCGIGLSTLCMVATGKIYPCTGWQQYVCGDVNKTPLQEIWKHSTKLNYLRSLRLKDFKQCIDCDDYNYCMMCVSRNYNESANGSMFDIPQITCDAARTHHEIVNHISNQNIDESKGE